jgi:short-subunit dehydrogenase
MSKLYVGIGIGPGMGLSTAERFAREGYDVVITGRDKGRLDRFAERLAADTGRKVEAVALDVNDLPAIQHLAGTYAESTVVLHYNAASMHNTSIFDSSIESLDHDIRVDITGALVAIKAFTASMKERKQGTVLLTGGGFALSPSAAYLTLSVGKAGIRAMAEALFPELAKSGIHIATVTVAKVVSAGSHDAIAAAEAFWNLHSQPMDAWSWEFVLN